MSSITSQIIFKLNGPQTPEIQNDIRALLATLKEGIVSGTIEGAQNKYAYDSTTQSFFKIPKDQRPKINNQVITYEHIPKLCQALIERRIITMNSFLYYHY